MLALEEFVDLALRSASLGYGLGVLVFGILQGNTGG